MVRAPLSAFGVAALLLPFCSAGLYNKNSPVIQVDPKKYQSEIAASNYTSVRYMSLKADIEADRISDR